MTTAVAASLRHTGLQVPNRDVQMIAPGLIQVGDEVGEVKLDVDDDFAEIFEAFGPHSCVTGERFYDWAGQCRDPEGNPLDLEDVFDWLRWEYGTERALIRASEAGCTVAQEMLPHGDGYRPGGTFQVWSHYTRQNTIDIAAQLADHPRSWWRLFDGEKWVELQPSS